MTEVKTKDTKIRTLGSSTSESDKSKNKTASSHSDCVPAKIVRISNINEKKKLELINQIINTTPSF